MAACVVGRVRDCALESPWFFVRLVERRALSPLRWPRGEMGARCRERDYASDQHSQFWGDIKLCLCEACWLHLIYIQLGFLARNPWIIWVPSCVHAATAAILEPQWDVCTGRRSQAKASVFGSLTETYAILQIDFGASCMNRASVFEWHKRFKEGTESVRDDESCGRSKEVNTPQLIGQNG